MLVQPGKKTNIRINAVEHQFLSKRFVSYLSLLLFKHDKIVFFSGSWITKRKEIPKEI